MTDEPKTEETEGEGETVPRWIYDSEGKGKIVQMKRDAPTPPGYSDSPANPPARRRGRPPKPSME